MNRRSSLAASIGLVAAGVLAAGAWLAGRRKGGRLSERLLAVALADLPASDSVLTEPSERWDAVLGGRIDADRWRYYERGFGTTCGVVAASWLEDAGAPPEMINRNPPLGDGFKMGWHIIKARDGARKRGWLREPQSDQLPDLRPGDLYATNHPAKDKNGKPIDGTHIGLVVAVEHAGDAINIETADGGQGPWRKQSAMRVARTVRISDGSLKYADGSPIPAGRVAVMRPGIGNTRLEWWIRLGDSA